MVSAVCLSIFLFLWRHNMDAFSALLALYAGNAPVTGEFPSQRSNNAGLDVFFDHSSNKRLNKRSNRQWSETPWCTLWRLCNIYPSRPCVITHSFITMTSSNGNIFRVTGPLCGEFTGPGEFPAQRPVTRSFYVFFDLHPNKRLSKQPWGWWFEAPPWSFWRQCNVTSVCYHYALCLPIANYYCQSIMMMQLCTRISPTVKV